MKTYFVFNASGKFVLVSNNNGEMRSMVYTHFPRNTIDILRNIGFRRV